MANTNAPYGFQPIKSPGGDISANPYPVLSSAEIFQGDLITINSSGYAVKQTSTTGLSCGVAAHYLAASTSTTRNLLVYDDPDQVFSALSALTSTSNQALLGARYDISIGTGQASSRLSGAAVGTTTSSSYPLLIVGFDKTVDNVQNAAYPAVQVKIVGHQLAPFA